MMTIHAIRSAAGSSVLAGGLGGDGLRRLLETSAGAEQPVSVLDFKDVQLVTASYFRAAFEWLWGRETCPVIANSVPDVREEIELALKALGLRGLFGVLRGSELTDVQPAHLEPAEAATYSKVHQLRRATAGDLYRLDRRVQPTAWSNRLALLYRQRLLQRESVGRQVFYSVCGG